MVVKIKKLGPQGHETLEMTVDEAHDLQIAEQGRYFIVDAETNKIVTEVKLKDGQELYMVPKIAGG